MIMLTKCSVAMVTSAVSMECLAADHGRINPRLHVCVFDGGDRLSVQTRHDLVPRTICLSVSLSPCVCLPVDAAFYNSITSTHVY